MMVKIQAVLLIYLLVGAYVRKKNIISDQSQQSFIDFLIRIALPCMIFESFHQELSAKELLSASLILAVSFGISVMSLLLGKVLYRRYPSNRKSILQYGTLISNSGFAGLPLVDSAYGSLGLFYASVFVIPNRIFMWSAGISLFTEADVKTRLKNIFLNPGIIAVFLGLFRMLTQFHLPTFVDTAVKSIGNCTASMSMIVVGTILADIPIKNVLDKDAIFLSFIRLIFLPAMTLIVLKFAQFETIPTAVGVILTAMPVGTTTALLGKKYNADAEFASKCVLSSTVLSLLTVPILTLFL